MKKPKNEESKSHGIWLKRKLSKKCLRLWTEVVKARAKGVCETCGLKHGTLNEKGRPLWLNAHHIEEKLNWALRFEPLNGVMLCPGCHKYNHSSAHRSPLWFMDRLLKLRGDEVLKFLRRHRNYNQNSKDWTVEMLQSQIDALEDLLHDH